MKNYIKPTFILADVSATTLTSNNCGITTNEIADIFANDFGLKYTETALNVTEACQDQYKVGMYCKFTSAESGTFKILGS